MKFTKFAVLLAIAPAASGFVAPTHQFARPVSSVSMSLEDLESKLLDVGAPAAPKVKAEKPKPAPKPKAEKPAPKPKEEKPQPAPKPKAEKPAPKPKPEKVKKVAPAPVVAAPAPAPVPVKASKAKVEKPKPVPAPPAPPAPSASSDAILKGVALGGAPLALGGLAALAAGRSALSSTLERRTQIQKEIEAAEKAKKAAVNAEVDGAGVAGALVSFST